MSFDDWVLALHVLSAVSFVAGIVLFWVLSFDDWLLAFHVLKPMSFEAASGLPGNDQKG